MSTYEHRGSKSVCVGQVFSILLIAFLALDGVTKLIQPKVVVDATAAIGDLPTLRRSRRSGSCCLSQRCSWRSC